MARIRTIKPGFFRSEDVSALPLRARLTWVGLWTQCDDQGRTKDNAKLIKADVWPLDPVSLADIEEDLETLADHGRIVRYEVAGKRYLEVVNWGDHQSINRPSPSKIPPPPNGSYPQVNPHGRLSEDSHQEGKGRERKGGDARARASTTDGTVPDTGSQPPQRTCANHPNGTEANCGPCKSARLNYEQWEQQQAQHRAAQDRASQQWPRHRCGHRHPPGHCNREDPT